MRKILWWCVFLLLVACQGFGQAVAGAGQFTLVRYEDEAIDGYMLWLPVGYDPARAYPVILSLHSSGQTGGTVPDALTHGPGAVLVNSREPRFDRLRSEFIVVSPHLTEGEYAPRQWFDRTDTLDAILKGVFARYSCDLSRVYLLGYSTGGTGTWGYASSHPHDFAAMIPVAGFTRSDLGLKKPIIQDWQSLAHMPIWAIYNVSDKAVSYSHIRNAAAAIEAVGGEPFKVLMHEAIGPRYIESVIIATDPSEVLGVKRLLSQFRIGIHSQGHIWENPLLYEWLLSHVNSNYKLGTFYQAKGAPAS